MTSAALLRQARARSGLTQAGLAARAGTSQPVISAYEHGRRDPSLTTLARLLAAAGERLDVRSLRLAGSDLPPPADLDEHGRRLVDVLSLADALPFRRHGPLSFPRIDST